MDLVDSVLSLLDVMGIEDPQVSKLLAISLALNLYCVMRVGMMNVRLKMHADHFNVLDDTHSQAQKDASRALENSSRADGRSSTLLALMKKWQ